MIATDFSTTFSGKSDDNKNDQYYSQLLGKKVFDPKTPLTTSDVNIKLIKKMANRLFRLMTI